MPHEATESFSRDEFIQFLLAAKRHTYAGQDDDSTVSPLLAGSRQLEYRAEPFFYRDIYFGLSYFVGQETVYYAERPVWSMSYAGGTAPDITSWPEVKSIYAFLRAAMKLVSAERPFRGPQLYAGDDYRYRDDSQGDIERFWGEEQIMHGSTKVYELRYMGGMLA
jgi:hypothetical protein